MTTFPKWNDLPIAILKLIFEEVYHFNKPERELEQCSLTCRAWSVAARAVLFRQIVILQVKYIKELKMFSFGNLIKNILYSPFGSIKGNHVTHLGTLANVMPFLEEITTDGSLPVYTALHSLILKGKFPHLKQIGKSPLGGDEEEEKKMYVSCINALQSTVSHIEIRPRYPNEISMYKNLLFKLDQFPKLDSIELDFNFNGVDNFIDFVESVVPNINLKSVTLNGRPSSSPSNPGISLQVSNNEIKPLQSVKALTLDLDCHEATGDAQKINIGDDSSLLYIMKKFPNLYSITSSCRGKTNPKPSIPIVVQFIYFLYNLPRCDFRSICTDVDTIEILSQVYNKLEESAPKNLKNALAIDYSYGGSICPRLSVKTNPDKRVNTPKIKVELKSLNDDEYPPHLDVLKKVGKFIHELSLTYHIPLLYNQETLLGHIINHCPRLERLKLPTMDLFGEDFFDDAESGIEGRSLKQLSLSEWELSGALFTQIAKSFPCIEVLELDYQHKSKDEASKDSVVINMSCLKHLKIKLSLNEDFDCDSICFKIATGPNNRFMYFAFIPIPFVKKHCAFEEVDGEFRGHKVKRITAATYEKSSQKIFSANFFINSYAMKEISIEYQADWEEYETVNCLAELAIQK